MIRTRKNALAAIAFCGTVGFTGIAFAQGVGVGPATGGPGIGAPSTGVTTPGLGNPAGMPAGTATGTPGLGNPAGTVTGVDGVRGNVGSAPNSAIGSGMPIQQPGTAGQGFNTLGARTNAGTNGANADVFSGLNLGDTSTPAAGLSRQERADVDTKEREITEQLNRAAVTLASGR